MSSSNREPLILFVFGYHNTLSGKKSQMNKYFAFSSLVLSLWFLPLSKCCYLDLPLSWNKTTFVAKKNKKNLTKYLILYSEEICSKYPEQMSASQNPATVSGKHHKIREQTFSNNFSRRLFEVIPFQKCAFDDSLQIHPPLITDLYCILCQCH